MKRLDLHATILLGKRCLTLFTFFIVPTIGNADDNFFGVSKSVLFNPANEVYPKHEVRAVWLTTIGGIDWPHTYSRSTVSKQKQQQELCSILDSLKLAGVNTILMQTRIRATTIYPSGLEPWDGCLSGKPGMSPGYDALKFAIDECHRRGMEFHAWIVTIPVGKWNSYGCRKLRERHPGILTKIGDEGYMNPEKKGTAVYLAKICREIATGYDVDGIHLDYIRYPETWKIKIPLSSARANITNIVSAISKAVKKERPWIKISCSPIGKYDDLSRYKSNGWNARTRVAQDAQQWLKDGLMDALFPMMYFKGNNFYPFAVNWKENSYGKILSIGLGIYFMSPKEKNWDVEEIKRQINVCRGYGLGHAFFRSKFFTDNLKGIYDYSCNECNALPALIPPMTWVCSTRPKSPAKLDVYRNVAGDYIEWDEGVDMSDGNYLTYNVYASVNGKTDITNPANLIATRLMDRHIAISSTKHPCMLTYAVTAMDRYGNESEPITEVMAISGNTVTDDHCNISSETKPFLPFCKTAIENDGKCMVIPQKENNLDAEYLTVETLQGTIIAIRSFNGGTSADISQIPDGIYVIRSLGKKGISHRLGFLAIKR
ncbi:glycoside hydrolase family 10 protein [Xylanibacter muris]|uniref:glycoside hydrolase family 10 protein n=1 Tax=Xylanibacter muris TaxID=2736290 RepID=UPI002557D860|nr:family 10 glycosylhydrolase [Xylanibacter muris]